MEINEIPEWIGGRGPLAFNDYQITLRINTPKISEPSMFSHNGRINPGNRIFPLKQTGFRPKTEDSLFFMNYR
jgi:hypothetical protein